VEDLRDGVNRGLARRSSARRGAMVKFRYAEPMSQEMSLEAVLGRVDQILAYQQALVDPGSLTSASSASTSSGFATQLASAQASQSSASAPLGNDTVSSAMSPFASSALPTSFDVSGVGGTTGLSGSARMLAAAKAAVGGAYNQGNHDAVSDSASQIQQVGTDCSGFVSYLMGPNGIGDWSQSYATPSIPTAPGMQPGQGSYVTIWNNPNPGNAGHVWIEILGQYFESSGSGGVHQMDQAEVNDYLKSGQYQPFHPAGM
jgi:hypothetical protein